MGLTIAPITLSYHVYPQHQNQGQNQGQGQGQGQNQGQGQGQNQGQGSMRFINCNVVQESSRSAEILPGDLFVGINGVRLIDEHTPAATTTEVIHTYVSIKTHTPCPHITYPCRHHH